MSEQPVTIREHIRAALLAPSASCSARRVFPLLPWCTEATHDELAYAKSESHARRASPAIGDWRDSGGREGPRAGVTGFVRKGSPWHPPYAPALWLL